MSRSQRSLWSFLSSQLFTAVTLVTGFIATPWLLHWLGEARFGAFRAATECASYLELCHLGLIGALLPMLARALGQGKEGRARETLAEGVRIFAKLTVLALAAGAFLVWAAPLLVDVPSTLVVDLRLGLLVGLAGILAIPLAPFTFLLEADNRRYLINLTNLGQGLFMTGLALVLAWKAPSITGQFVALASGSILSSAVLAWHGQRRLPLRFKDIFGSASPDCRSEIWSLNRYALGTQICHRLSVASDNIIVAAMLGAAAVVPFYLTQRLPMLVAGQIGAVGLATWASFANLHAKGEKEVFVTRFLELNKLLTILAISALVPAAAYNRHFVALWVGKAHYGGDLLTLAAVVVGFGLGLMQLWRSTLVGTGHVRSMLSIEAAHALVNLAASLALTWWLSTPGPLLGTAAALLIYAAYYPFTLRRVYGIGVRRLAASVGGPLLLGLPLGMGLWWWAQRHKPAGWAGLAGELAAASLLCLMLGWYLACRREEREAWWAQLKGALGRR